MYTTQVIVKKQDEECDDQHGDRRSLVETSPSPRQQTHQPSQYSVLYFINTHVDSKIYMKGKKHVKTEVIKFEMRSKINDGLASQKHILEAM